MMKKLTLLFLTASISFVSCGGQKVPFLPKKVVAQYETSQDVITEFANDDEKFAYYLGLSVGDSWLRATPMAINTTNFLKGFYDLYPNADGEPQIAASPGQLQSAITKLDAAQKAQTDKDGEIFIANLKEVPEMQENETDKYLYKVLTTGEGDSIAVEDSVKLAYKVQDIYGEELFNTADKATPPMKFQPAGVAGRQFKDIVTKMKSGAEWLLVYEQGGRNFVITLKVEEVKKVSLPEPEVDKTSEPEVEETDSAA